MQKKRNKKDSTGKDFSFSTIENFDNHISSSIVGYKGLIADVITLSEYFIEPKTNVYDIGCSTGKLIRKLAPSYRDSKFIGIEPESNFQQDLVNSRNIEFKCDDLFDVDMRNSSIIFSIFTMQFIPVHRRLEAFEKVYAGLNKGGAFILAEKTLASDPKVQDMMSFMYYDHKRGKFNDSAILDKEKALRSIMKCLTVKEYIAMLKKVGFKTVAPFWRRYNFNSLIAVK